MNQHDRDSSRLFDDFQVWLGDTASAWDAQPALDYKLATDDPRLTFWTHEMVDDLIEGYLPATAVLLEDEAYEVAETICQFFRFLDETGLSADDSELAEKAEPDRLGACPPCPKPPATTCTMVSPKCSVPSVRRR